MGSTYNRRLGRNRECLWLLLQKPKNNTSKGFRSAIFTSLQCVLEKQAPLPLPLCDVEILLLCVHTKSQWMHLTWFVETDECFKFKKWKQWCVTAETELLFSIVVPYFLYIGLTGSLHDCSYQCQFPIDFKVLSKLKQCHVVSLKQTKNDCPK